MTDAMREKAYQDMVKYGIPNIRGKYAQCDCGTISAYQRDKSEEENDAATEKLMKILIGLGYSVTVVNGEYYNDYALRDKGGRYFVKMLLVFDKESNYQLCENLVQLGEKFGQEFITFYAFERKLFQSIGTSYDSVNFPYHESKKIATIFFTSIGFITPTHPKRPWIFETIAVRNIDEFHLYDHSLDMFPKDKQDELRKSAEEFMRR